MYRKHEDRDYGRREHGHEDEVEKSVRMIAEFVKREIEDIKEKSVSLADLEHELGSLKEELLEKMETVPGRGERRLSKLESEIADMKHMKSRHDDIERKVGDLHAKISSKVLEGSQIDKNMIDAYLKRMEELERSVNSLQKIIAGEQKGVLANKIKESVIEHVKNELSARQMPESARRAIDDRIDDLASQIEELRSDLGALGAVKAENVDSYISEIKAARKILDDLEAEDVEGRARKIEEIGRVIENLRSDEVREYVNSMRDIKRTAELLKDENLRGHMDEIRNVKKSLDELKSGEIKSLHEMVQEIKSQHTDDKLKEIRNALESVKTHDIHAQMEEISRLHDMLSELKKEDVKMHAEELKSVKDVIDKLKSEDVKQHIIQMKELKSAVDALKSEDLKAHAQAAKEMQQTIEKLRSEDMKNRLEQVRAFNAAVRKMDTEEMKRYQDLLVQVEEFKFGLESTLEAVRAENEKHYRDIEKHGQQLKEEMEASMKRVENEDAKRYSELRDFIESEKKEESRNFAELSEGVGDVRKSLDEEIAARLSIDKRIADIQKHTKSVSSEIAALKSGESAVRAEIADASEKLKREEQAIYAEIASALGRMKGVEEDFERRIKQDALNVVTQQLGAFSETMDRKLPGLATKDDVARIESRIEEKIESRERAPRRLESNTLERKMEILERRIGQLVESFQGYQGSYVIE